MASVRLHKYGVGHVAADLIWVDDATIYRSLVYGWHIRALIDARHGDPNVYGGQLWKIYSGGATVLPIIGWTDGAGNWKVPRTQGERDHLQNFARGFAAAARYVGGGAGGHSNIYEVWNEPNSEAFWDGTPSVTDYWHNVYVPVYNGLKADSPGAAVVMGGLAFGTMETNGVHDAADWIAITKQLFGEGAITAYSIHPYGYTNPADHHREATSAQSVARAKAEYDRADAATSRPLLVTEMGRRTDVFSESSQAAYLNGLHTELWSRARVLSNWPIRDGSAGYQKSGLLRSNDTEKPALATWRDTTAFMGKPVLTSL